jgi:formylglycine-generating enzyme required for sulfatase activity
MNPFSRFADPGSSEWMNACSAGGQYTYGSGARVDSGPQYCNYLGTQLGTTHPVGTRTRCTSPSPTYESFDLSGNVAEWEDSCEKSIDADDAGAADACRTRGGSFASPLAALSCETVPASAHRRDEVSPEVGFRCCAE